MIDEQLRCQNPSCGLPIASIEDLHQARDAAHLKLQVKRGREKQETPYLVMDYFPRGSLRTHHPQGTRLPLDQVVAYTKQIALALQYAHKQHVIHQDVKPANILLNEANEAVLSDFGLAIII